MSPRLRRLRSDEDAVDNLAARILAVPTVYHPLERYDTPAGPRIEPWPCSGGLWRVLACSTMFDMRSTCS